MDAVETLEGSDGTDRQKKLWEDVKRAVYGRVGRPRKDIDPVTQRFIEYIGVTNVATLRNFTDVWDYKMKARYLLYVMSMDSSIVEPKVRGAPIYWPRTSSGNLRSPFQEVVNHELEKSGAKYNDSAYEYLRLCKNVIKHWVVMPAFVKVHMECFIMSVVVHRIERWNPLFWCTLYAATAGKIYFSTTY